ncbi:hypothetical protein K8352_09720 [Flavobacteriaceae bacterium F89]|uniref:Lipoprotein n=1 Tax=Cerina litoralis TaxID=2874477 RepID=A0AAE3JPQ4_9FLAO|nr:hypothetical protein [Cerina litoralis]MCG2461024.1 hypothetical protein [Cerina litoralis]
MQTYRIFIVLFACTLLGCSKSGRDQGTEVETGPGVEVDYTVILAHNGQWSGSLLNANMEHVFINDDAGPFKTTPETQIVYREGSTFSLFQKKSECEGEITSYDFGAEQEKTTAVFDDLGSCKIYPKALAHSPSQFFMAYGLWNGVSLKIDYFIRIIDRKTNEVKDVSLDKEPLQLVFSNNRLFALCLDAKVTGIHSLIVVDAKEGKQIHEINLGLEAQKIAKNYDGNILVSFASMHLIIDSSILKSISEVRYGAGKEAKFGAWDNGAFFDDKLYYLRPGDLSGSTPQIPAVYDFSVNVATFYYYENFLTSEQLQFEYNIGDTSMVSYDAKNNLILIGYRRAGNSELGGLLRIKLAPEPKLIDHIDLEGVPYAIFVN